MDPAAAQIAAVSAGAASPTDLVEEALARIEACADRTNAFTGVRPDAARAEAARTLPSDGPLAGLPVVVKDLFDVAGLVTSGCSEPYRHRPPARRDATIVARLRAAGAIIVAKTNQHELAAGATGLVSAFGPARNPWDPARIPGGSSSGSAVAVAAGAVTAAIGSDTGGSIRMPASFCGLTGLKPTHGAVAMGGAMPLCPELDTGGPLAWSAVDCRLLFDAIAGPDPADPLSRPPEPFPPFPGVGGVRIGVPESFLALTTAEVRAAVLAAAEVFGGLGARVLSVPGPALDDDMTGFNTVWARFADLYPALVGDERVSPEVGFLLSYGAALSEQDRADARARLAQVTRAFAQTFQDVDVLLAPTTPFAAPPAETEEVAVTGGALPVHRGGPALRTRPANEAGLPALAFPVGVGVGGMPLSAQLVGPAWSEPWLLSLGEAFQAATEHHDRRPRAVT